LDTRGNLCPYSYSWQWIELKLSGLYNWFLLNGYKYCYPVKKNQVIIKVIVVISSSPNSIEDSIESAVTEVSKTVRNVDSVYV
jgi:Dodecin